MTHFMFLTRWTKKALIRIGAGLALGLVASSGLSVMGKDADSDPQHPKGCESAFAASCENGAASAVKAALAPDAVNVGNLTRNGTLNDKPDEGAYFTVASNDPQFDPCMRWDGTPYSGPGTVLNPHADTTDCLPGASPSDEELIFAGGAGGAAGIGLPGETPGDEGGEYLDVFGPGNPIFGPLPSGGGIPIAQIITGTPTISNDDPTSFDPTADPIPLPAPAVLFLTGLAGMAGVRGRKKRAA